MSYKTSAPGSLMMLGEHAVLHGGQALVAAINYRMHVTLTPRQDSKVKFHSVMGNYESLLSTLSVVAPFEFVLTTLKKYQTQFPSGFELTAQSEFSHQIGFASSAAVTVATLRAIHAWLNIAVTDDELILEARNIVREVQGMGSGADVAASVLGGVVAFRAEPFRAEKLGFDYPITVVYSGTKTKTAEVIRYVNDKFTENRSDYEKIMKGIAACAEAGILASRNHDHATLGSIMNQQQDLMRELKVNTPYLQTVIDAIQNDPNILGTKISGSGLGDCAIGLGEAEALALDAYTHPEQKRGPIMRFDCKIDSRGVRLEEN